MKLELPKIQWHRVHKEPWRDSDGDKVAAQRSLRRRRPHIFRLSLSTNELEVKTWKQTWWETEMKVQISLCIPPMVPVWRSCNGVGRKNEVTLRQSRWPSSGGHTTSVIGMQPAAQANSAFYPQRNGKWLPAKVRCCSADRRQRQDGSFHLWINVWWLVIYLLCDASLTCAIP